MMVDRQNPLLHLIDKKSVWAEEYILVQECQYTRTLSKAARFAVNSFFLCPGEDSNLQALAGATTSR